MQRIWFQKFQASVEIFLVLKSAPPPSQRRAAQHDSFFLKGNLQVLTRGGINWRRKESVNRFSSQLTEGTFNIQASRLQPLAFIHDFSVLMFKKKKKLIYTTNQKYLAVSTIHLHYSTLMLDCLQMDSQQKAHLFVVYQSACLRQRENVEV